MINVPKKYIKTFVEMLHGFEEKSGLEDESFSELIQIGYVDFNYMRFEGSIDIYKEINPLENAKVSGAYGVRFKDNSFGIIITDEDMYEDLNLYDVLKGTLAHEIGHFLNGDLNKNNIENTSENLIDRNLKKQSLLLLKGTQKTFSQSAIFGLFRNGINHCEIKADIKAVELIGMSKVVLAHQYSLLNITNPTIYFEKQNRIKRLFNKVKNDNLNKLVDSSLEITLYPN